LDAHLSSLVFHLTQSSLTIPLRVAFRIILKWTRKISRGANHIPSTEPYSWINPLLQSMIHHFKLPPVQSEKELRIPPIDAASYDIPLVICLSVSVPVIVPSKTSITVKARRAAIGARQVLMQDTFAAKSNAQVMEVFEGTITGTLTERHITRGMS